MTILLYTIDDNTQEHMNVYLNLKINQCNVFKMSTCCLYGGIYDINTVNVINTFFFSSFGPSYLHKQKLT